MMTVVPDWITAASHTPLHCIKRKERNRHYVDHYVE